MKINDRKQTKQEDTGTRTAILYNFLIGANIMASSAIVLMRVLRKCLRRMLGNSCICFGWLLVAVRLLLPLSFANPIIYEYEGELK